LDMCLKVKVSPTRMSDTASIRHLYSSFLPVSEYLLFWVRKDR